MIITENCRPGSVPIRSLWNLMPGTGGFRKMRWADARRGKGRRGGLRIIYCYFPSDPQIWLMTLYDKSEAADLTAKDNESFESRDGKRTEGAGSQTGERGPSATEDILMAKRDVFSELMDGVGAMKAHREGKITLDRKSTRLNSSHLVISYAVFCLKKKTHNNNSTRHTQPLPHPCSTPQLHRAA